MDRRRFIGGFSVAALLGSAGVHAAAGRGLAGAGLPDRIFADGFEGGLLDVSQLVYLGAFRLPAEHAGGIPGDNFFNCTKPVIGMGTSAGHLYVTGSDLGGTMEVRTLAEIGIPALIDDDDLNALNIAALTQPFANLLDDVPVDGNAWTQGRVITGLYREPNSGRVAVNVTAYYDTGIPPNSDTTLVLNQGSAIGVGGGKRGYFKMTGGARSSGWISPIPAEFQGPLALNGTHLFGNSDGYGINGRASIGPSAFVYDLASITGATPPANGSTIAAQAVIDYPFDQPLTPIDDLTEPGQIWTVLSNANYGFIVPGTRTYLAIGKSGGHASGSSYGVPPWGGHSGFHPNDQSDTGNRYWAFRVDDMIAARHGQLSPHQVRPYAHGNLPLRFQGQQLVGHLHSVAGAAFDQASGRLYIALSFADDSRGDRLPLIVAYGLP